MKEKSLPDVPDWIDEEIDFKRSRDVQDHHIVNTFLEAEEPFLSIRRLMTEHGMTREGMQKRVDMLEGVGILDSCPGAGGRIYWIQNDLSKWPIPPDVEVEPVEESNETTLSELTERPYVKYSAVAVLAAMIGSVFITGFVALSASNIQVPDRIASGALLIGILAAMFSVVFGVVGAGSWVLDRW